jgi:prepilin-type N-terminal cleavage/methylation domain-containing protein
VTGPTDPLSPGNTSPALEHRSLRPDAPGVTRVENRAGDAGFTLVEILVVVVILGVLATVAAFALTNLSDRGTAVAQTSDQDALSKALDAYFAEHGSYATEELLVSSGLLRATSSRHDIVVSQDGLTYTIVAQTAGTTTLP